MEDLALCFDGGNPHPQGGYHPDPNNPDAFLINGIKYETLNLKPSELRQNQIQPQPQPQPQYQHFPIMYTQLEQPPQLQFHTQPQSPNQLSPAQSPTNAYYANSNPTNQTNVTLLQKKRNCEASARYRKKKQKEEEETKIQLNVFKNENKKLLKKIEMMQDVIRSLETDKKVLQAKIDVYEAKSSSN